MRPATGRRVSESGPVPRYGQKRWNFPCSHDTQSAPRRSAHQGEPVDTGVLAEDGAEREVLLPRPPEATLQAHRRPGDREDNEQQEPREGGVVGPRHERRSQEVTESFEGVLEACKGQAGRRGRSGRTCSDGQGDPSVGRQEAPQVEVMEQPVAHKETPFLHE